MKDYFRLGGAAMLMLGAIFISRAYEGYLNRRIAEYRGLIALLSHAEGKISRFLSHGCELWRDFSDEALEKCELLKHLREGVDLKEAFEMVKDKMSLSKNASARLTERLSSLGRGYKDSELSLLSSIKEHLTAEMNSESEEAEKNIKVVRALLLGGALAMAIMVI
ncbi:MAG: hypothetical protein IJX58_04245 [Clostridia bacterium]|nr:hypothetical protein [Clostridia bacterium]